MLDLLKIFAWPFDQTCGHDLEEVARATWMQLAGANYGQLVGAILAWL
ncbi:hypothetical protein L195_g063571, partial [Trifolium pratense]